MIEVEFIKDFATYKKGDIAKFALDLAFQIISVEKVAKKFDKKVKPESKK